MTRDFRPAYIRRVLIALLFSILVHAEDSGQQICKLTGTIRLEAPTQFFCMKDMEIDSGTRIITGGHPLQITAVGAIKFGDRASVKIISFVMPLPQSAAAGPIFIYAHDAYGDVEISNRGASDKDLSGDVLIEYMARDKSYSQSITVTPGTRVELTVNGQDVPVSVMSTGQVKAQGPKTTETKVAEAKPAGTESRPHKPHKPRPPRPKQPRYEPQPGLWGQPQIFQWRW